MDLRILVDFADGGPAWSAIDDRVMGGVSRSGLAVAGGVGVFSGRLSTAHGGGFASVRTVPADWELAGFDRLVLTIRGDGRRYRLRLRTSDALDGVSYEAAFDTVGGEWLDVTLPLAAFRPVLRGRPLPDAPALDPGSVRTFGLMVADRQVGDFRLELARIAAARGEGPDAPGDPALTTHQGP